MAADESDSDRTKSFVALSAGTMVSHYRIVEKIGAGGMGEVYLADDTELRRRVALKFLPSHLSRDEDCRKRFKREAQAAAKLDHANIVPVYEVGEFQGRPFFSMAHIEGQSLRETIKQGKLTVPEAIGLTIQICEGLHEAHTAQIVHRDIKPGNIIIDKNGKPRLLDFGLATLSGEEKLTKTGSTLGTVGYMSPEQIESKQVDHRSDLFSVGVILYEMLTGRRPFEGDNDAAVVKAITNSTPEPIARFKSGTTAELQQIISKALSKDPSLRYQHADDLAADLKRLSAAARPRRSRKSKLMIAAATLLVVIAVAYGVYTQFYRPKTVTKRQPKRLVVLPFTNLGEKDQSYFASGLTDEVIQRLSSISGLSIVSRMSAAKMKRDGDDIKTIGKDLKAQYVLDASALYQLSSDGGQRIRLTTQLINVTEDRVVWSEIYDTTTTEVFNVQASIAEKVAEKMNVVLLPAERKEIWEAWHTSAKVWKLYLRGNMEAYRYSGYGEQSLRLGLVYLHRALALDSNFSLAWVRLADVYGRLYQFGFERNDSTKALCWHAAERASQLSKNKWVRNWPLSRYYYQCERDWPKALQYLQEAYRGRESESEYLNYSHHILRRMGRWQEAYDNLSQVILLEPKSFAAATFDLAADCVYMRRYEEAERFYIEMIEAQPDFWDAYDQLFILYCIWQGDFEKARKVVEQSKGLVNAANWSVNLKWIADAENNYVNATEGISLASMDTLDYHFALGTAYFSQGKRDSARYHFEQMRQQYDSRRELLQTDPQLNWVFACMFAGLGEREQALDHMQKALNLLSPEKDALAGSDFYCGFIDMFRLLGDSKGQLEILDSAMSMPGMQGGLGWFLVDPDYRALVLDPGFKSIMEKHADSIQWRLYRERLATLK